MSMQLRALDVYLGPTKAGSLFQYGQGSTAITRFDPDEGLWRNPKAPILSWATIVPAEDREAFWQRAARIPFFNGAGDSLPAFFQNLLPEGQLREHLAQLRGCSKDDHFEILAACGDDLPGAVAVYPATLTEDRIAKFVTQKHDGIEATVTAVPIAEATSLSGIQPKLSLIEAGGRYVARSKNAAGKHVIAKLPTAEVAMLPELEALSLQLAAAAGVNVCRAQLVPLTQIATDIPFALAQARQFLAVERFDRQDGRHIHCEEFAQILGVPPLDKYRHPAATYANFAGVLIQMDRPEDTEELLRRLAVNELLGNRDAHAKNFGVIYEDPRHPRLSPAYDIVAHAAYSPGSGHALPFTSDGSSAKAGISPRVLAAFCNSAGILETKGTAIVRETGVKALEVWPGMIAASEILDSQKENLMAHLHGNPIAQSILRRQRKARP